MSLTDLSLAIGTPYGSLRTFVSKCRGYRDGIVNGFGIVSEPGPLVGPGALKPKVGDGIESRRPLSAPVLHSFIPSSLLCFVCCCTSTGVWKKKYIEIMF